MKLVDIIKKKRQDLRDLLATEMDPDIASIRAGIKTRYSAFNVMHKSQVRYIHVAEVGTSEPSVTTCRDEILNQILETTMSKIPGMEIPETWPGPRRFSLIDVRHDVCQGLYAAWGTYPGVKIYCCAVGDTEGTVRINIAGHSTFIDGIQSPCIMNKREDKIDVLIEAPCIKFTSIDDGTIDVLLADLEGCEWYVLKHMESRPLVIQLETHTLNSRMPEKEYINPFIDEIDGWMQENGYLLHAITDGDTIFVRRDFEQLSEEIREGTNTRVQKAREARLLKDGKK